MKSKANVSLGLFRCLSLFTLLATLPAMSADFEVNFTDISDRFPFLHVSVAFGGVGLAGAAFLDYNNDGNMDIYMNNGKTMDNALFHNNGDGTFSNVAHEAGVANGQGNNGVAVGDINNDGWPDIFLTGEGGELTEESPIKFYLNNRDGSFSDITESSGIPTPGSAWSSGFSDLDNDGYLDLVICISGNPRTGLLLPVRIYRNNGDLTFSDVTDQSGILSDIGSCAVGFSDYDQDGDRDVFIANCTNINIQTTPIQLFRNEGNMKFTDVTADAGLAQSKGFWMSINFADFDNDGNIDLFSTNSGSKGTMGPPGLNPFTLHGLFQNNGDGTFTDVAAETGIDQWEFAWGASFADFNNDGFSDLLLAGNYVDPLLRAALIGPGIGNPGRLLLNGIGQGDPTFIDSSESLGVDMSSEYTSGVAYGDLNRDGFPDVVVMNESLEGPRSPYVLQNNGNDNHWLGIKLVGTVSNRDALGAHVTLRTRTMKQVREVYAASSYMSSDQKQLMFGLGDADFAPVIDVRWPSGCVERFLNKGIDTYVTLVEGRGLIHLGGKCP